jgi:hypothetical protein
MLSDDKLYLDAIERWIRTVRQTAQMNSEMIRLAQMGARQMYYQVEDNLPDIDLEGPLQFYARWKALEFASFQRTPNCIRNSLAEGMEVFSRILEEQIKSLRRRMKVTRPLG